MFLVVWFLNFFSLGVKSQQQTNLVNYSFKSNYTLKKLFFQSSFSKNYNFFLIYRIFKLNFNLHSFLLAYVFKKLIFLNDSLSFNSNQLLFKNSNFQNLNNFVFFSFEKINSSYKELKSINYLKFFNFNQIFKNFFFSNNIQNFKIKFSVTDFFKYLNNISLNNINILFLRKNKVFNKGRYSRNRQYYRTGVYWCLYVNIVAVVGIYFWFYRFNMNFGYLWWILYFFFFSMFFSRCYSLNLFNIKVIFIQIIKSYLWFLTILYNFLSSCFFFFKR